MESQSGHHPGHHGHSAPHNSTLPHSMHVGGKQAHDHHQINLDNHHHKQKHKHSETVEKEHTKKTHATSHHHHHHVSRKSVAKWARGWFREQATVSWMESRADKAFVPCDCAKKKTRSLENLRRARNGRGVDDKRDKSSTTLSFLHKFAIFFEFIMRTRR